MSTAQAAIETSETETVLRWRFDVLVRAGYEADNALVIAGHLEADLHDATRLLALGCPQETAMTILL